MTLRPTSLALLALVAGASCTPADDASPSGGGGSGGTSPTGGPGGRGGAGGEVTYCEVILPTEITEDLTVEAGCVARMDESVDVGAGATLTLQQGVRVEAAPQTVLSVGWGYDNPAVIRAEGTEAAPVVFTSSDTSQAGQWGGVHVGRSAVGGSRISHAVIEYAGNPYPAPDAALLVDGQITPGALTVDDTLFRDNLRGGVHVTDAGQGNHASATFASFARNGFVRNGEHDLSISPVALSGIDLSNDFEQPILLNTRDVEGAVTWPAFEVPIIASQGLRVTSGASLEIQDIELRFRLATSLSVGAGTTGRLRATNVVFTSSEPTPSAGDWCGLYTSDDTQLQGCTLRYAGDQFGGSSSGCNAVALYAFDAADLTLSGTTFEDNAGVVNISISEGSCVDFTGATPPNSFDLTPCEVR